MHSSNKRFRTFLKEPFLQFCLIGLALFAADAVFNNEHRLNEGTQILVSEQKIKHLSNSFQRATGDLPSQPQLASLIDDFVQQEIAVRAARSLQLDRNDPIIRRRLNQKLQFMIEDNGSFNEPSDSELEQWLHSHPAAYIEPQQRSFTQLLFSKDDFGDQAYTHALERLEDIKSSNQIKTLQSGYENPSLLPKEFKKVDQIQTARWFGQEFSEQLFNSSVQQWLTPIQSGYGWHLVYITDVTPRSIPSLSKIRQQLRDDWIQSQRQAYLADYWQQLRQSYQLTIHWPQSINSSMPSNSLADNSKK